jgi:hypothetical protein
VTYLDDYAAIDAVNISTLKQIIRYSPRHYQHLLSAPRKDTTALAFGRLVHCAVLEPDALAGRYVVEPDYGDLRTKAARADRDAWRTEHIGAECVSDEWMDKALGMSAAVRGDPVAAPYLNGGRPEVTLTWSDAETGVSCKGRVDWLSFADRTERPDCIVGLKTTRTILPDAFARGAVGYGYSPAWAFYADGYERMFGRAIPSVEIVVESDPPHDVVVYEIPDEELDEGRREYREALVLLARCRERNEWPGVSGGKLLTFRRPKWAQHHDDDDLEGLEF